MVSELVMEVHQRDHRSEQQVEVTNTDCDGEDQQMDQQLGWSKAAGADDRTGHMDWVWLYTEDNRRYNAAAGRHLHIDNAGDSAMSVY